MVLKGVLSVLNFNEMIGRGSGVFLREIFINRRKCSIYGVFRLFLWVWDSGSFSGLVEDVEIGWEWVNAS